MSSVKVLVKAMGENDRCVDVTLVITSHGIKKDIALLPLPRYVCVPVECTDWTDGRMAGIPSQQGQHFLHLLIDVVK